MAEKLKPGDKVYRYEDPAGDADEFDQYPKPWLNECPVVRVTRCATVIRHLGRDVFWYEGGNRRFCRTPEEALQSYIVRKGRAVMFSQCRLDKQKAMLTYAEAGAVAPDPLHQHSAGDFGGFAFK